MKIPLSFCLNKYRDWIESYKSRITKSEMLTLKYFNYQAKILNKYKS